MVAERAETGIGCNDIVLPEGPPNGDPLEAPRRRFTTEEMLREETIGQLTAPVKDAVETAMIRYQHGQITLEDLARALKVMEEAVYQLRLFHNSLVSHNQTR